MKRLGWPILFGSGLAAGLPEAVDRFTEALIRSIFLF